MNVHMRHAPGSRMEVICVDLDSTLTDTRQRRRHSPTVDAGSDWTRYAMLCGGDAPIDGTVRLVRILHAAGYGIHLVSNRPEATRKLTEQWLARHHIRYEVLHLRQDSEPHGPDYKADYVRDLRTRGYEPLLFLEDWPANAAAIEQAGVPVLCVNPRYGDDPPVAPVPRGSLVRDRDGSVYGIVAEPSVGRSPS